MPHNRYFVESALEPNSHVSLGEQEFHHMHHVMRQKVGDRVELVNGRNCLGTAQIEEISKKSATLSLLTVDSKPAKQRQLILAAALIKLARLEVILEKGVELGADKFLLFPAIFSEKVEVKPEQMHKLRQWTINAMKQCGRLDLPEIVLMPALKEWVKPEGALYFGDTRKNAPRFTRDATAERTLFFIGPERGFHPDEIKKLETSWGAKGVQLHENILRVETACLAALLLAQTLDATFDRGV